VISAVQFIRQKNVKLHHYNFILQEYDGFICILFLRGSVQSNTVLISKFPHTIKQTELPKYQ
jgi:hypothetical protein